MKTMVISFYPMPVRILASPPTQNLGKMYTSIYPMPVRVVMQSVEKKYPIPPNISQIVPINDGKEGFAGAYSNMYYVAYSSHINPSDIIGNSSATGIHWSPAENNTDPPSHQILTIKNPSYDCTYFPAFDSYNNLFAIAWIENNIIGRLNLKYGESSIVSTTNTAPVSAVPNTGANNTIFVRPNKSSIAQNSITQNIPLSDIYISDIYGNTFDLNVFHQGNTPYGWEIELINKLKSVKFIQSFKRAGGTLKCKIGTAPEAGTVNSPPVPSMPIANCQVNVYCSNTNLLLGSFYSDVNGKFEVPIKYGDFIFEIIVNQPSIYFSQIFV